MSNNINKTFYVTMPFNGQLVVREARFKSFICRPCEIYGRFEDGLMITMDSRTCKFELVLAGVSTIYKNWYDVKKNGITIYKTKFGAMESNCNDLLYDNETNFFDMGWLGLTFSDMMSDFAQFASLRAESTRWGIHYQLYCYAWNGVKPCEIPISWSYTYDIVNRKVYLAYSHEIKRGVKYYPTYQDCKADNEIEVFEFDDAEQDKVQVRFTFRVEACIGGKDMDDVRRKWENLDMGREIEFVELVSAEDAETYNDLTSEIV